MTLLVPALGLWPEEHIPFHLRRQHHGAGIPEEAGGHPVSDPQLGGSGHPSFVRGPAHSAAASVYPGQAECAGGFSEPQVASPLLRSFPPASSPLACDDRPLRHFTDSSSPSVLFANGRSTVGRHGCHAPVVGRPPGLIPRVLAKVRQSRGLELTLVAPFWTQHAWFPELLVEIPFSLPRRRDLLRQPHFHHYHQNLPVLQLTAYRLSSDPHVISDSLRQWLVSLPTAVADLPE